MKLEIPEPLRIVHEEAMAAITDASRAGGKTEQTAKALLKLLQEHMGKDEAHLVKPLSALPWLAQGKTLPEMIGLTEDTEKLKTEIPTLLEEHRAVIKATREFLAALSEENHLEYADAAKKLVLCAWMEEHVIYPAAIVAGEYWKEKTEAAA